MRLQTYLQEARDERKTTIYELNRIWKHLDWKNLVLHVFIERIEPIHHYCATSWRDAGQIQTVTLTDHAFFDENVEYDEKHLQTINHQVYMNFWNTGIEQNTLVERGHYELIIGCRALREAKAGFYNYNKDYNIQGGRIISDTYPYF